MTDKIEFKNSTYERREVAQEAPENLKWAVKAVRPAGNRCLENSVKMAQKAGVKIVEGYLVTRFADSDELKCVGHVWNESNGIQFDITGGLISCDRVEENAYYPKKTYTFEEIRKEPIPFPFGPLHAVFSTDVKANGRKLRDQLNSKSDEDKEEPKS